jgi:hypothetical protein
MAGSGSWSAVLQRGGDPADAARMAIARGAGCSGSGGTGGAKRAEEIRGGW